MAANPKYQHKSIFKIILIKIRFLVSLLLFIIGSQVLTFFTFFPLPMRKLPKKKLREKVLMHFARFINFISFNLKIRKFNRNKEDFKIPAIIISNHVSYIDIPLIISIVPRLVLITNPNIKHSRLEWIMRKYTNLHLISENLDESVDYLKKMIIDGYSILIFPEGVRSPYRIRRFHKGAFMFAEMFNLDIIPVFNKAEGDFIEHDSFFSNTGKIDIHVLDRITPENKKFGVNYEEKARNICQYYRDIDTDYINLYK